MSWHEKAMDKYGDKIILGFMIYLLLAIVVILWISYRAIQMGSSILADVLTAVAIMIGLWQYIVSKYEQEKRERKLTTHTLKQEKCRDVISKIDQLHKMLSDIDKRLKYISMENRLITAQGNHTTDDLVRNVNNLMYDINSLRYNYINILIPTYFESNYDKLKDLKRKIKRSLKQINNELKAYHSYLTSIQNNNVCTHRSSPPTMPITLFKKIHTINSEFHKKLYTADPYIIFPSEDIDNG